MWIPASVDTVSVIGWADESFQIAVKPEVSYCVKKEGVCWYTAEQREYVPERPQKKVLVDNAYLAKHGPIVRERMKMAGVRLGAILNTIFKDDSVVSAESETLETKTTQVRREDMRRLADRIEKLEDAIRELTKQLQKTIDRQGLHQE